MLVSILFSLVFIIFDSIIAFSNFFTCMYIIIALLYYLYH